MRVIGSVAFFSREHCGKQASAAVPWQVSINVGKGVFGGRKSRLDVKGQAHSMASDCNTRLDHMAFACPREAVFHLRLDALDKLSIQWPGVSE